MFRVMVAAVMVFSAAAIDNAQIIGPSQYTTASAGTPRLVESRLEIYYNQQTGTPIGTIIQRAFERNGEIRLARLEVDKARARLTQARARGNPTLEIEQSSGRLVGNGGDGEISAGISVPLDVFGQRARRIDLANAEISLREAEVAARKRELSGQILTTYAEALAALRELQVLEDLLELDTQTVRFVQIRVNEGESAPLEVNLLQAEVERLRARRSIAEGKLQAAVSRLKFYSGMNESEILRLSENLATAQLPDLPPTADAAIVSALQRRPEIRVAVLEEELAGAGLRLVRAQARPDVAAYTRYSQGKSQYEDPRGPFQQRDRNLTFGVSVSLPVFDRKQGQKAEAEIAIRQAQERRLFSERIVRNEIVTAFQRLEAARQALGTLEASALPRFRQNVETIRQVYEVGELKITDLIAEQRRLLDANRDLTDTLTERYRAQADLYVALANTPEN
jgi:cobalt-zinc-cadmium efflux system outer membrane protein